MPKEALVNPAQRRLEDYRRAAAPPPRFQQLWPLYGAGFGNLGDGGQPIQVPVPEYGPDELLVRHDATGLCFSDVKIIRLGPDHPRIRRDMQSEPVTPGHEVSLTVSGVGEHLRGHYRPGDRFIVQADIFVDGVGYAYGYEIQGGLSQYAVIDQRILKGDEGNYLVPVQPGIGYAEAALAEPWACVVASYGLTYRTELKSGGTTWIVNARKNTLEPANHRHYTIGSGFDEASHPDRLWLTGVPGEFAAWLRRRARVLGIQLVVVEDAMSPPPGLVDDIVVLGAEAGLIELVSPRLADQGVLAIIAGEEMPRRVAVDVGRIHYDRRLYVGGRGPDIAAAYSDGPVRSSLKPGGRAWFVGSGGPLGRMHVQLAIQSRQGPAVILCTDVSARRLDDLYETFAPQAEDRGIEFACLNPTAEKRYQAAMEVYRKPGFDDMVVLASDPAAMADAATYLAPRGVMNVFAGIARGTKVDVDAGDIYLRGVRFIGHSASSIADLEFVLRQTESGEISPNRSVAAIGSLTAARDGLLAVRDAVFPGKIVIYPAIREMPLTALPDLHAMLPTVHAKLKNGREWTVEAEEEFLRRMLP